MTGDFGVSFAHLRRKYLQPPPQVRATVLVSTCNCPRKYLREKMLQWLTLDLHPSADAHAERTPQK